MIAIPAGLGPLLSGTGCVLMSRFIIVIAAVVRFLTAPWKLWSGWREHRKAKDQSLAEAHEFYLSQFDFWSDKLS
jgi:hypothetical protein